MGPNRYLAFQESFYINVYDIVNTSRIYSVHYTKVWPFGDQEIQRLIVAPDDPSMVVMWDPDTGFALSNMKTESVVIKDTSPTTSPPNRVIYCVVAFRVCIALIAPPEARQGPSSWHVYFNYNVDEGLWRLEEPVSLPSHWRFNLGPYPILVSSLSATEVLVVHHVWNMEWKAENAPYNERSFFVAYAIKINKKSENEEDDTLTIPKKLYFRLYSRPTNLFMGRDGDLRAWTWRHTTDLAREGLSTVATLVCAKMSTCKVEKRYREAYAMLQCDDEVDLDAVDAMSNLNLIVTETLFPEDGRAYHTRIRESGRIYELRRAICKSNNGGQVITGRKFHFGPNSIVSMDYTTPGRLTLFISQDSDGSKYLRVYKL
jgi:hypothetical protein